MPPWNRLTGGEARGSREQRATKALCHCLGSRQGQQRHRQAGQPPTRTRTHPPYARTPFFSADSHCSPSPSLISPKFTPPPPRPRPHPDPRIASREPPHDVPLLLSSSPPSSPSSFTLILSGTSPPCPPPRSVDHPQPRTLTPSEPTGASRTVSLAGACPSFSSRPSSTHPSRTSGFAFTDLLRVQGRRSRCDRLSPAPTHHPRGCTYLQRPRRGVSLHHILHNSGQRGPSSRKWALRSKNRR